MGKKQLELLMAVLILAGAFCVGRLGAQMRQMRREITTAISRNTGEQMVVIDAGHGGFDSGKVGINGVMEKDINLLIAKKVQKNLEHAGIRTLMTIE